jgi:hypothetical protein
MHFFKYIGEDPEEGNSNPNNDMQENEDAHPGEINNQKLVMMEAIGQNLAEADQFANQLASDTGGAAVVLRPNLVEGRDFELISAEQWSLLLSWYGGGPCIERRSATPSHTTSQAQTLRPHTPCHAPSRLYTHVACQISSLACPQSKIRVTMPMTVCTNGGRRVSIGREARVELYPLRLWVARAAETNRRGALLVSRADGGGTAAADARPAGALGWLRDAAVRWMRASPARAGGVVFANGGGGGGVATAAVLPHGVKVRRRPPRPALPPPDPSRTIRAPGRRGSSDRATEGLKGAEPAGTLNPRK